MKSTMLALFFVAIITSFYVNANERSKIISIESKSYDQQILIAYDSSAEGKKQCKRDCLIALTPCLEGANSSDAKAHCNEQYDSCIETCE